MSAPPPVFRFAPSPNGRLHLGHAYSALLNHDLAQATGGRFLLRIEDIDLARSRPEFETAIHDDLAWLGLAWERPVRRQSEHFATYAAALARLRDMGLVYPAFLSRAAIAVEVAAADAAAAAGTPVGRDPNGIPLYPPFDRDRPAAEADAMIAAGAPFAWRLDMERALAVAGAAAPGPLAWRERDETSAAGWREIVADPAAWGDVILARRETPTSYHLAVVVDDAAQGVTDIVRGRDLYEATAVHRLLQVLLGLPAPAYRHHRLILGADGRKLAKSAGASALAILRTAGETPADIRRRVGLPTG